MEGLKITLLILTSASYCACAPDFRRGIEVKDPITSLSHSNDEVTLSAKDSPSSIFLPTTEEEFISEASALVEGNSLGELLRNRIGGQMSYETDVGVNAEDEPQLIPVPLPKPIKSSVDFKKPISEHKQAILKSGAIDPYEKLLESFIRGIMSKVLKAEIKEVRVEETGPNKTRKTIL